MGILGLGILGGGLALLYVLIRLLLVLLLVWLLQFAWGGLVYFGLRFILNNWGDAPFTQKIIFVANGLLLLPMLGMIWEMLGKHQSFLDLWTWGFFLLSMWPSFWVLQRLRRLVNKSEFT